MRRRVLLSGVAVASLIGITSEGARANLPKGKKLTAPEIAGNIPQGWQVVDGK